MASTTRIFLAISLVSAALLGVACDRPPSKELTDWTPTDHDGEQKGGSAKQGVRIASSAAGGGTATLVEIAWRQQCSTCHGPNGKGDGPQGAMFKAADLSAPAFQDKIKDEEIAASITNGKGRMPKFDLPADVVTGLVSRVRSFRGK